VILDSSAIVAILLRQPGFERLLESAAGTDLTGVGTPTLAETGIVVEAKIGRTGQTLLARFLQEGGGIAVPFGDDHWRAAVDAFARFGRGRHPAALNFGDCLTYATARLADEPLLCVGDEFAKTDLVLAQY
jgi:ribonuclease VapC